MAMTQLQVSLRWFSAVDLPVGSFASIFLQCGSDEPDRPEAGATLYAQQEANRIKSPYCKKVSSHSLAEAVGQQT